MSIGDNIRKRRKELKLTQTKLGQLVHKSSQVISNWERGYTTGITIEDLIALADALKISILSLIPRVKDDSNSYREEQASFETDYISEISRKIVSNRPNHLHLPFEKMMQTGSFPFLLMTSGLPVT